MLRTLILILLLLGFCPVSSSAQKEGNRTITMELLDSLTQKPVAYAAILCYAEGEKEPSRYGVSDDKGHVEINRLLKGNYLVSIEHLTYVTALKYLSTQEKRKIDLGKVFLVERPVGMDEVVIRGDGPVVQKGDTTEYNARFFNPGPNQYLGELIKKMPGLEVIGNEIFFKGQKVQSLTVEGRPFFVSDKGVALENLPAYTVKKVQVFKEKRRRHSGLEERANAPLSMNIVLNDHTKQGLIGNLAPGYGTDSRYLVKGMLGHFGKKATTALIVSCNNLSKDTGSGTNYSFGANGSVRPQMSAGSAGQEGDVRNLMVGIDHARGSYADNLLYLNGIWTNTDRFVQSITKRETSLTDGILNYHSDDISDSRNNGGGLNFRKNLYIDRSDKGKSALNLSTYFSLNGNQSKDRRENQFSSFRNGLEENGSKGNSTYRGENENILATGGFSLENCSKRRGFRFSSLLLDFSWSRFGNDYRNISHTTSGQQAPVIRDMKKKHDSDNLNLGAGLNFGLPGKLSLSYRVRFQKQTSDIKAWDADSLSASSGGFSEESSSKTQNTQVTQDLELSKTFTFKTTNGKTTYNSRDLTLSMTLRPLWKKTTDKDFSDTYRKWDLIPLVHYRDRSGHFNVKYTGDITHPSIQQLQPVLNDDNPMYIVQGNPSLHPSYTHQFTLYRSFRYFSINADCSSTRDKIIGKQEIDRYGVTRTMPVNANGDWRAGLKVSTTFGLSRHIDATANVSGRYVRGVGYQGSDKYNSDNWTAKMALSLMYKRNYFDFSLGAFADWSDSRFSTQQLEGQTTWIKGLDSRMNWGLPLGFTLLSDLSCAWYSGFRLDEKPSAIWNAELCKSIFKGKVVLSVKGYDLLNKTRNLKTSYADNYVEERQVNVLRRFVLFGLTYKFGKF